MSFWSQFTPELNFFVSFGSPWGCVDQCIVFPSSRLFVPRGTVSGLFANIVIFSLSFSHQQTMVVFDGILSKRKFFWCPRSFQYSRFLNSLLSIGVFWVFFRVCETTAYSFEYFSLLYILLITGVFWIFFRVIRTSEYFSGFWKLLSIFQSIRDFWVFFWVFFWVLESSGYSSGCWSLLSIYQNIRDVWVLESSAYSSGR